MQYGLQVWNALPLRIREIDNLQTFKCKLKCHYFESAFCDVPYRMFKVSVFLYFSRDIDNCYCDICNDLVVYCESQAYDVSLSQMIDTKVDSYLTGLISPHYYY